MTTIAAAATMIQGRRPGWSGGRHQRRRRRRVGLGLEDAVQHRLLGRLLPLDIGEQIVQHGLLVDQRWLSIDDLVGLWAGVDPVGGYRAAPVGRYRPGLAVTTIGAIGSPLLDFVSGGHLGLALAVCRWWSDGSSIARLRASDQPYEPPTSRVAEMVSHLNFVFQAAGLSINTATDERGMTKQIDFISV